MSRARVLVEFSRPFTLVAPALGFASGAATAVGAAPREAWSGDLILYPVIGLTMAAVLNAASNALNQIYDLEIDRVNKPKRPLPSGRLTVAQAWAAVIAAMVVFLFCAWALNPLCAALAPVALIWIASYSYTKRFTDWSHLWLGGALAIAPVGGYIAVTGEWSDPAWLLVAIAFAVTCWVGGFDIFYALQDEAFDRKEGLHSLVVRLGQGWAIIVAKLLHGAAIAALIVFGKGAGLGIPYFAGVMLAVIVLGWEHRQVKPGDLSKLNAAFFNANGIVSIIVFLGALVDRVL